MNSVLNFYTDGSEIPVTSVPSDPVPSSGSMGTPTYMFTYVWIHTHTFM